MSLDQHITTCCLTHHTKCSQAYSSSITKHHLTPFHFSFSLLSSFAFILSHILPRSHFIGFKIFLSSFSNLVIKFALIIVVHLFKSFFFLFLNILSFYFSSCLSLLYLLSSQQFSKIFFHINISYQNPFYFPWKKKTTNLQAFITTFSAICLKLFKTVNSVLYTSLPSFAFRLQAIFECIKKKKMCRLKSL